MNLLKIKLLFYAITYLTVSLINAQKLDNQDINSIEDFHIQLTRKSPKPKPKLSQKPLYVKLNPLYWVLYGSLRFYQTVLSAQLSKNCMYEPSCSRFSKEAIQQFGIIKGIALSADRLTRCSRSVAKEIPTIRITKRRKYFDPPKLYHLKSFHNFN
ncbi:MAG: membrane protein insertion efficiency factor YidD [Bacteroidia bacterium]|nr:membrane protein insertion efficiency factor YidD [Bacteroidia bacterium]